MAAYLIHLDTHTASLKLTMSKIVSRGSKMGQTRKMSKAAQACRYVTKYMSYSKHVMFSNVYLKKRNLQKAKELKKDRGLIER